MSAIGTLNPRPLRRALLRSAGTLLLLGLPLLMVAATARNVSAQLSNQVGNSSLSGTVLYAGNEPATARLYLGQGGKYRQSSSRFRGGRNVGYSFPNLLPGRYELIVTAPGAKPKRIWGVQVGSFDQKQLNVTLLRGTPEEEQFFMEEGDPIKDDMPRDWAGGWVSGILLTQTGNPVEGVVSFYRGPTLYTTVEAGAPTLPAYFESREVPPGTWDVLFTPSAASKLRPVRVEKVVIDPNNRTVLGAIKVPAGAATDPPMVLPLPERTSVPVPVNPPRRRPVRQQP